MPYKLTESDVRGMSTAEIAEAINSGAILPDGWEFADVNLSSPKMREEARNRGSATAPTGRHPAEVGSRSEKQDPANLYPEIISGADFSIHEKEFADSRRILLVGIPRSGTTWVGSALSAAPRTIFIDEPDDERRWPQAMYAKRHLSRYPMIAPGDRDMVGGYSIAEYIDLWEKSFSLANPFSPGNVIVKSTFVVFCLEWLVDYFSPDAVCWVMRHPMNTLASWMEYKRKLHPDEPVERATKRMGWQYAGWLTEFDRCLENGVINHVVWHESLSNDFSNFEVLAKDLGLEWNYRSTDWLMDMNKQGDGGHWGLGNYQRDEHLNRISAEQTPDRWRERLSEQEAELFLRELERWPAVRKYLGDL